MIIVRGRAIRVGILRFTKQSQCTGQGGGVITLKMQGVAINIRIIYDETIHVDDNTLVLVEIDRVGVCHRCVIDRGDMQGKRGNRDHKAIPQAQGDHNITILIDNGSYGKGRSRISVSQTAKDQLAVGHFCRRA